MLNVDILPKAQPDALLDLVRPVSQPVEIETRIERTVLLDAETLDLVFSTNAPF